MSHKTSSLEPRQFRHLHNRPNDLWREQVLEKGLAARVPSRASRADDVALSLDVAGRKSRFNSLLAHPSKPRASP